MSLNVTNNSEVYSLDIPGYKIICLPDNEELLIENEKKMSMTKKAVTGNFFFFFQLFSVFSTNAIEGNRAHNIREVTIQEPTNVLSVNFTIIMCVGVDRSSYGVTSAPKLEKSSKHINIELSKIKF